MEALLTRQIRVLQLICSRFPSTKQQACGYAKKLGIAAPVAQRKFLDVEADPEKLCKFVCGANTLINGKDPEIKPDSEYPEWLWTLRTERGEIPMEELEFDTWEYWERMRELHKKRNKIIMKTRHKNRIYGKDIDIPYAPKKYQSID